MPLALKIEKLSKMIGPVKTADPVWILKDIDLDIYQGERIRILGPNGAGKSTLLKILSRITSPTSGRIMGRGDLFGLLEAGTVFQPELSGAENIYLNGAMLGRQKAEIKKSFEEIVSFAGIERDISNPVKHYSSGMQMRLACAIAIHLKPDILLLDEALAFTDPEFQRRCLDKLHQLSRELGTTILMVSHDSNPLSSICNRGFVLYQGRTEGISDIGTAGQLYEKLYE